jgi:CheY-like chemotaxis protein
MLKQKSVLIVENDATDTSVAANVARSIGIDAVLVYNTASKAQFFLEQCLREECAMPDVIVLDLDLEHESGFDLVSFRRTHPKLMSVPLIVWSVLGDHYRELCDIFKVTAFVPKWQGKEALRDALTECIEKPRPLAAD